MPAKTNSLRKAPYHQGSLQHWVGGWIADEVVWLDNDPFHATLRIDRVMSGMSAKYVTWTPADEDDRREFPMFITDLVDLIQHAKRIENGLVCARWRVRKRGQNYGICLA
jgi:hypothetical protein